MVNSKLRKACSDIQAKYDSHEYKSYKKSRKRMWYSFLLGLVFFAFSILPLLPYQPVKEDWLLRIFLSIIRSLLIFAPMTTRTLDLVPLPIILAEYLGVYWLYIEIWFLFMFVILTFAPSYLFKITRPFERSEEKRLLSKICPILFLLEDYLDRPNPKLKKEALDKLSDVLEEFEDAEWRAGNLLIADVIIGKELRNLRSNLNIQVKNALSSGDVKQVGVALKFLNSLSMYLLNPTLTKLSQTNEIVGKLPKVTKKPTIIKRLKSWLTEHPRFRHGIAIILIGIISINTIFWTGIFFVSPEFHALYTGAVIIALAIIGYYVKYYFLDRRNEPN